MNSLSKNKMIWLSPCEWLSGFINMGRIVSRYNSITWKRRRNVPILANISLLKKKIKKVTNKHVLM